MHIVPYLLTMGAACLFLSGAIFSAFLWATALPTVYESYSTGYCDHVYDPDGVYSCENMPPKFHHVWTQ